MESAVGGLTVLLPLKGRRVVRMREVSSTDEERKAPRGGPEINPSAAEQPLDWGNWVVFN